MEQVIQVLKQADVMGQNFAIYGTATDPMFKAKDVADWIGLTNVSDMVSRVDSDEVTKLNLGGLQGETWMLTENGLYEVLMQSRKPVAREFKRGIKKVLHEIRTKGGYIAATNDMTDEEIMAKALLVAQSTIERRDQRIKELETANKQQQARLEQASCQISEMSKDIDEMKPKAEYYDMILNNKSTVLTTSIAQDYGMSAIAFNKVLSDLGIQRKVAGQWILYTQYIKKGYMQSKPITITRRSGMKEVKYNSEWTQSGRIFLYDILKKNGILPMIER